MNAVEIVVAPRVPCTSKDACDQPRDESGEVEGQDLSEDLDFHSGLLLLKFGMEEVELLWVRFPYEFRPNYREGVYEDIDSDQNQIILDGSKAIGGAINRKVDGDGQIVGG